MSVAALMQVLRVVLVVYHELALEVRCRSYRSIVLPTLGRYIREVALFAPCFASLFIAGPVWVVFFIFAQRLFVAIFAC